jgi:hypothetical protein
MQLFYSYSTVARYMHVSNTKKIKNKTIRAQRISYVVTWEENIRFRALFGKQAPY